MTKIGAHLAGIFLTVVLTACYVPTPQKMGIPDYSIGPISSDEFPGLVSDAIPSNEGEIHVFGKASWHGFYDGSKTLHFTEPYFYGVAALTDETIFMLMWDERERRYEIIERVPYSNIKFQPRGKRWSAASITILMDESAITVGEQSYTSFKKTYLSFVLPSGIRVDREKNTQANLLFEEKVERYVPDHSSNSSADDY
jgi:hypothetical protein